MTPGGSDRPDPADRPLVSVVISAYNVADYIDAAIESALGQTYPAIEVIVVNDGSTDDTAAIIERYRSDVVVIDQANGGPSAARNAGLAVASGSIIGLLDGDDVWLPERVERLTGLLDARPDIGMVTSDSWVMDDFTPTTRRSYPDRRKRPFPASEDDQIEEIARFNFLFISVLFRRELIDRCGTFTEGTRRGADIERSDRGLRVPSGGLSIEGSEDYDLWTRFLISGSRAGFIDEPLGYYRVRPGSISQSRAHQVRAHLAVLERNLPALWKLGARGYTRDAFAIGSSLAARGERGAAATFFARSLRAEGCEGQRVRLTFSALHRLLRPSTDWIADPLPRGNARAAAQTSA